MTVWILIAWITVCDTKGCHVVGDTMGLFDTRADCQKAWPRYAHAHYDGDTLRQRKARCVPVKLP